MPTKSSITSNLWLEAGQDSWVRIAVRRYFFSYILFPLFSPQQRQLALQSNFKHELLYVVVVVISRLTSSYYPDVKVFTKFYIEKWAGRAVVLSVYFMLIQQQQLSGWWSENWMGIIIPLILMKCNFLGHLLFDQFIFQDNLLRHVVTVVYSLVSMILVTLFYRTQVLYYSDDKSFLLKTQQYTVHNITQPNKHSC